MLPKSLRVKRQDFPRIIKEGLVFYSSHLSIRVFLNKNLKTRAAIAVSSKIAKSSVERHFIKRQISSLLESKMSLLTGGEFIISCKKIFLIKDRHIINNELNYLLSSAKLLK